MINLALEVLLSWNMDHLRIATGANGSHYTVKPAIGRIVDDPPTLDILVNFVDFGVESRLVLKSVRMPEICDSADDLLSVGIASLPLDRRVKAIQQTMNLETGCVVYFLWIG